eukprot:c9745_g1_i2.p1 GENE.c9745_g1_i2~~c9745_g1_i2.p1  ORF type:complete len:356 (+),score=49.80 c9745_g1_i2:133-1200(+)
MEVDCPQAARPPLLAADLLCGDDDCAICLDPFDDANPSQKTTCGHKFHFQCVLQWQERSNCCPLCWGLFNVEGEDVPTVARFPASPLQFGQRPPASTLNAVAANPLDLQAYLIDEQLSVLFGLHHVSPPHTSNALGHTGGRHSMTAHQSTSTHSASHHRFSRNRSRSYHIDASGDAASRGSEPTSPTQTNQARSPASPFSKLRTALTDVFDRSRRLRVRHRDHLQPQNQNEASSSRSPSQSPNQLYSPSTSSHSPSSCPITPTTQQTSSAIESASPLNLNVAPPRTQTLDEVHNAAGHDGSTEIETLLVFMNKHGQSNSDHDTDHDARHSSEDPTFDQPTTPASEVDAVSAPTGN